MDHASTDKGNRIVVVRDRSLATSGRLRLMLGLPSAFWRECSASPDVSHYIDVPIGTDLGMPAVDGRAIRVIVLPEESDGMTEEVAIGVAARKKIAVAAMLPHAISRRLGKRETLYTVRTSVAEGKLDWSIVICHAGIAENVARLVGFVGEWMLDR